MEEGRRKREEGKLWYRCLYESSQDYREYLYQRHQGFHENTIEKLAFLRNPYAANVVAYSFISYYLYKKVKKLGGFRNNV